MRSGPQGCALRSPELRNRRRAAASAFRTSSSQTEPSGYPLVTGLDMIAKPFADQDRPLDGALVRKARAGRRGRRYSFRIRRRPARPASCRSQSARSPSAAFARRQRHRARRAGPLSGVIVIDTLKEADAARDPKKFAGLGRTAVDGRAATSLVCEVRRSAARLTGAQPSDPTNRSRHRRRPAESHQIVKGQIGAIAQRWASYLGL